MEDRRIILGSGSPRRKDLMYQIGYDVNVLVSDVDESFDKDLKVDQVAEILAIRKAIALRDLVDARDVLITADSVVILDDEIYNKPSDPQDAFEMLSKLSGRTHQVITGVCVMVDQKQISFSESTDVTFANLNDDEINAYISDCAPFDKAGGYGIQDWIGWAKIERISGSYSNVMGLPVAKLYSILVEYCKPKIR
ncbi:MAG: Maf family protein [Saprospiraceae bacterium]